jgi:DNA-binding CsgD family transcriptional regulator
VLVGRGRERARLAQLLEAARSGSGSALVLLGEPGSGKSVLLEDLLAAAEGVTVLRTQGIESEAPLAFAALQRLLRPLLPLVGQLPAPQARAVRVALGEEINEDAAGAASDRFLVFLGVLSLLAEAAETRPVVAVVDDAHWLDGASAAALLFVARRLQVERVALVFAARTGDVRTFDVGELEAMTLSGLDLAAGTELLRAQTGVEVSVEVAAQLLASTGGNPLALVEVPRALSAEQLADGSLLPGRLPVTGTVERVFLNRARRLSDGAQALLLVAAADDSARLATVLQATATLGADRDALAEVEQSGLVTVADDQITLRHPLVRSALYGAATSGERRRAHAALAGALTREEDVDRRAWHRSSSVVGPDESVVAELAEAAERSGRRGGHEAASAAWARAAELSSDSAQRARFLFAGSMAAWISAHPDRARNLIDNAVAETRDPLLLADARRLRGRIEWNTGSVRVAKRMLLDAAVEAADHDAVRAREIAAEAVAIAAWGGDSGAGVDATSLVPPPADDAPARQRAYDQLLRGLAHVVAGDSAGAAVPLRRAFLIHEELPEDYELLPNLSIAAFHLGELDRSEAYLTRLLTEARNAGVLVMVLYALTRLAMINVAAGRWSDAASNATEAVTLGEVTGHDVLADAPGAILLLLAALRGDEAFGELAPPLEVATARGTAGILDVVLRDVVHWAHGVHQRSAPASAFHRFAQMSHDVPKRMAGVDRIESAVRADQTEAARLWVDDFASFAAATGQAWPAAIAEHGEALLADPGTAESHFVKALELHDRTGQVGRPFNRARTQLAYGEFLRRSRRRVDARTHLRAALEAFEDLRARPWAERAAQELRASGETARKRDETAPVDLTPQERQVAQLVQRGMSNREVAGQLFVSPRTVDFHLRNVFAKTGVTSRLELAQITLT